MSLHWSVACPEPTSFSCPIPRPLGPHVTAVARRLAAEGATAADDLTKLPGVGPSLAAAMGDLGFISYGQLAALSPDDARHLETALGIARGRSDIDGWAAAAARLDRQPVEDDASGG